MSIIPGVKLDKRQVELKFQNHIIDSYAAYGGHAQKWASEWQKGKPDLICALKSYPMHLLEVKHLPSFGPGWAERITNALSKKQRDEAKLYLQAGGIVYAAVVGCDSHANKSKMGLFHTQIDNWFASDTWWADYQPGKGYDVPELFRRMQFR